MTWVVNKLINHTHLLEITKDIICAYYEYSYELTRDPKYDFEGTHIQFKVIEDQVYVSGLPNLNIQDIKNWQRQVKLEKILER